jgi:ankyrin repeat protein
VLLDGGADPCAVDGQQRQPLHYAAQLSSMSIVVLLVDADADVLATTASGLTAAGLARACNHGPVYRFLEPIMRARAAADAEDARLAQLGRCIFTRLSSGSCNVHSCSLLSAHANLTTGQYATSLLQRRRTRR